MCLFAIHELSRLIHHVSPRVHSTAIVRIVFNISVLFSPSLDSVPMSTPVPSKSAPRCYSLVSGDFLQQPNRGNQPEVSQGRPDLDACLTTPNATPRLTHTHSLAVACRGHGPSTPRVCSVCPPNAKSRLTPSTSGGANPSAHGDRHRGSKMGLCQTSRRTTYLFREQLDSMTVQYLSLHGIS